MKTLLRSFFATMLCLVASVAALAQSTVTFDATTNTSYTGGSSAGEYSATVGDVSFVCSNGLVSSGAHLRLYQNSTTTFAAKDGYVITKIVITATSDTKKGPDKLSTTTGTYSATTAEGTWTGSETSVVFSAAAGQCRAVSIVVTYKENNGKKAATLAYSSSSATFLQGVEAALPTLTKETDGALTVSSDNVAVAKVDADGKITLGGATGTATITVKTAETSTYNAAEATCAITVLATETATLATSVGTGKYLLVVENDSKLMSAYAPETTKNYYYLNVNEAAIVGDKLYAAVGGAFTFTKQDDGNFTIQDIDGNYIYADANYNNFSFSSEVPENNLWSVEIASDGSATISNVATGQYALYSVTYSSIGCYSSEKAVAGDPLPKLYALDSTTTALRPAAEAASALSSEAYNILGQRVASDAKGLVIKGGKLSIRK